MKKQTLTEEISKMKSMMNKLLNEDFFSYNKMDNSKEMGMNDEHMDTKFKVGDIVIDPQELNDTTPGKILKIFPNLESAEGQEGYDFAMEHSKPDEDKNDIWYLIDFEDEATGLFSKKYANDQIEYAPEGLEFRDEDGEDHMCSRCNGTGEGSYDGSTCSSCGGSGVESNDNSYDDYDGPDDDYDPSDVEGKEWGGIDY